MQLLLLVAGGVCRFVDGLSRDTSGIPTGFRNLASFTIAWVAAMTANLPLLDSCIVASFATASIVVGHTNWNSTLWQALRFGLPAAVSVAPYLVDLRLSATAYVVACAWGGVGYPLLKKVDRWLPRWWLFDGFEAYARIPLGAAVLGSPSFIVAGKTTWTYLILG